MIASLRLSHIIVIVAQHYNLAIVITSSRDSKIMHDRLMLSKHRNLDQLKIDPNLHAVNKATWYK